MKIYYSNSESGWFHTGEEAISFGGTRELLTQRKSISPGSFCLDLSEKDQHAGPLVGILTGRKTDNTLAGNGSLFIRIQEELLRLKGCSFVFTAGDIRNNQIKGFIYSPDQKAWKPAIVPLPDVVYNRIPFRRNEKESDYKQLLDLLKDKNIPFFNPGFINKFQLYLLLQEHPILKDFLPDTIPIENKNSIESLLNKYNSIYLKSPESASGKGLYKLEYSKECLLFRSCKHKETFLDIEEFWDQWGALLQSRKYFGQEAIKPVSLGGQRCDFRILAHANFSGYEVTGVGIRQSAVQDITTHVPHGGSIRPYEEIRTKEHDQFIKTVVEEAGKWLTDHWGFFGEFSIDAGVSSKGNYYLFEINSKPMSFDEQEIEKKRIKNLCRLFFQSQIIS